MLSTRYKVKLAAQVMAPLATVIARTAKDEATQAWAHDLELEANSVLFALAQPKPPSAKMCSHRIKAALSNYPISHKKQADQLRALFSALVEE